MPLPAVLPLLAVAAQTAAPSVPAAAVDPAIEPGRYALTIEIAGVRAVPLLGESEMRTVTTAHVDVTRQGALLLATERVCAIVSHSPLFRSRAPAALLAALVPQRFELAVDGADVRAILGSHALGFEGESMPARDDDPRLRDPDGNGKPGALMHVDVLGIGTLDLDLVAVWSTRLVGRRVAPGVVVGSVEVETQERILSGLPFPGELGPLRVDARASSFTLARLAAGARPCGDLDGHAR